MKRFVISIVLTALMLIATMVAGCSAPQQPNISPVTDVPIDETWSQETKAPVTEVPMTEVPATETPEAEPTPEVLKLTETQAAFAVKTSSTAEPTVFTASIFLPEGWQLREDDGSDSFPYLGRDTLFDMRYIYDETGSRIGAVGILSGADLAAIASAVVVNTP